MAFGNIADKITASPKDAGRQARAGSRRANDDDVSWTAIAHKINADKGREKISFEGDEFDERAKKLAEKVAALIEKVEFAWPMMGQDTIAYLLTAHDALDAAADELARVLKKAEKAAA